MKGLLNWPTRHTTTTNRHIMTIKTWNMNTNWCKNNYKETENDLKVAKNKYKDRKWQQETQNSHKLMQNNYKEAQNDSKDKKNYHEETQNSHKLMENDLNVACHDYKKHAKWRQRDVKWLQTPSLSHLRVLVHLQNVTVVVLRHSVLNVGGLEGLLHICAQGPISNKGCSCISYINH